MVGHRVSALQVSWCALAALLGHTPTRLVRAVYFCAVFEKCEEQRLWGKYGGTGVREEWRSEVKRGWNMCVFDRKYIRDQWDD